MRFRSTSLVRDLNLMIAATDDATMQKLAASIEENRKVLSQLADQYRAVATEEEKAALDRYLAALAAYGKQADEAAKLALADTNVRAAELVRGKAAPLATAAMGQIDALARELGKNTMAEASRDLVRQLRNKFVDLRLMAYQAITWADDQQLAELDRRATDQRAAIEADLATLAHDANVGATAELQKLQATLSRFLPISREIVSLAVANSNTKAVAIAFGPGKAAFDEVIARVGDIFTLSTTEMARTRAAAEPQYGSIRTLLLAMAVGAMALGMAAAAWIALGISRGLSEAMGVAQGDLSRQARIASKDELGALGQAINTMVANLQGTAAVADKIAQGDLTVEAKPRSAKDALGVALKAMVAKLREIVGNMAAAVESVAAGSQQSAATAETLSQGSTEQAAAAEQASSAMEEMAANVRHTAENTSQTERIATLAAQNAERGARR